MFGQHHQRTFDYIKYNGTPLAINGNLRKKTHNPGTSIKLNTDTNDLKKQKQTQFKVLKTQSLQKKASKIESAHKQNYCFAESQLNKPQPKTQVKPRKQYQNENRKSGIEYLFQKSPFQPIQKRDYVPSSKWFQKETNKQKSQNLRRTRHSLYEAPSTRQKQLQQNSVYKCLDTKIKPIACERKHQNLDSNILLG